MIRFCIIPCMIWFIITYWAIKTESCTGLIFLINSTYFLNSYLPLRGDLLELLSLRLLLSLLLP